MAKTRPAVPAPPLRKAPKKAPAENHDDDRITSPLIRPHAPAQPATPSAAKRSKPAMAAARTLEREQCDSDPDCALATTVRRSPVETAILPLRPPSIPALLPTPIAQPEPVSPSRKRPFRRIAAVTFALAALAGAVALTQHLRQEPPPNGPANVGVRSAIETTATPSAVRDTPAPPSSPAPPAEEPARSRTQSAATTTMSATTSRRRQTNDHAAVDTRATPQPEPPSADDCVRHCHGNVDCALACVGTAPAPAIAAEHSATVPSTPDRDTVQRALESRRDAVSQCSDGHRGWAITDVTFASTGRVTTATVRIPYAGTPAGSCVARAVRDARIPPFANESFHVTYSYPVQ